jgi:hypothetical protein
MNKALLSHLSSYYKAAFNSNFSESTQEVFAIELFSADLCAVKSWMHDGILPAQRKGSEGFDFEQLVRLYVFADYHDFPALRRTIMSMLVRCQWGENPFANSSFLSLKTVWCKYPNPHPFMDG